MSIPSNLYAEKVFAEHPIALWSLDETVDYVSFVNESNRDISDWNMYNATQTDGVIIAGTIYQGSGEVGLAYSYDGKFWSTADFPSEYSVWATGYGNGYYLVVATRNTSPYTTNIFISSDLRVWNNLGAASYDIMTNGIAYGNNKFVCIGYDGYVTIVDPVTSQITYGNAFNVSDAFGGIVYDTKLNRFIVISAYEPKSGYSSNGTTWTVGGAIEPNTDYISMVYTGGLAADGVTNLDGVTFGLSSYADRVYPTGLLQKTTNGGVTWTDVNIPVGGYYSDIAFGNGVIVVVDAYAEEPSHNCSYSFDGGQTWNSSLILSDQYEWFSVTFFNGRFWAFSYGQDVVASSVDGSVWEQDYFNISIQAVDTAAPAVKNSIIPAESAMPVAPFPNSKTNFIRAVQYVPFSEMMIISPTFANLDDFNRDLETFSVGAYIYADTPYVLGYDIGYEYYTGTPNELGQRELVRNTRFFSSRVYRQWSYVSETFVIPPESEDISVVIKARYLSNTQNPYEVYDFYINGLSVGQWSEEFQAKSLGINLSTEISASSLGAGLGLNPTDKLIHATSYGNEISDGYYVASDNQLFARNTSVPMVYGSGSVTKLTHNPNGPSLILDGNGFLNESGRFQEYTFETWIRARVETNELRRIFGPVSSEDGIYINGPFLTVMIGGVSGSHFIGDWFRPILLNIKLGVDYANVLVNGEQVISLSFSTESIDLALSAYDWVAFYAYEDIPSVELDSISIYSYLVPTILIKRRLAFGQAVESPEGVNRAYGGTVTQIDYKFADYTSNYSYPAMGRFDQGIVENIDVSNNRISPPNYSVPDVVLGNMTAEEWKNLQPLGPSNGNSEIVFPASATGYLYLDNFNLNFQSVAAVYGIYKVEELVQTEKVLFTIKNDAIKSYFKASLIGDKIYYIFNYWGELRTLYFKTGIVANTEFLAGADIANLSSFFGEDIQTFFSNPRQLKLFIGNESLNADTQFYGSIARFGIATERNILGVRSEFDDLELEAISIEADAGSVYFGNNETFWTYFVDGGNASSFSLTKILNHIASYTIVAKTNFGKTYLDIETSSYWEDYIPLSHFAQYVDDIFGNKYYDVDFIQFNIDHPSIKKFIASSYDTSGQMVRSFISFQYLSTGANNPAGYFTSTELMPKTGVIYPGENWMTTKYEVIDGAVIYPPANVDIEKLAIVTHIEMNVSGISTNPVSVKKIEYASEAFNDFTSNPVGTKFGTKMYPYTRYSSLMDYKARNPFKIYKGSTPHLYLTSDSGINRVGTVNPLVPQGLSIPINEASAEQYRMIALQMFMLYNKDSFSSLPTLLFEIEGSGQHIKFYTKSNDRTGKRGRIFAVDGKTGQNMDGMAFYINGKLTRSPVISLDEWTVLGVGFANTVVFDEYPGALRISDTILFNNISYYESTNLQEIQRQSKRSWSRIYTDYIDWSDLLRGGAYGTFLWNEVLIVSTISYFGIDPGDIFKAYTGTNKIIINGAQDITISDPEYRIFSEVEWSTTIATPV